MGPGKYQPNPFEEQLKNFQSKAGEPAVQRLDLNVLEEQLRGMTLSAAKKEVLEVLYNDKRQLSAVEKLEAARKLICNFNIATGVPVPRHLATTDQAGLELLHLGGTEEDVENFKGDVNWLGSAVPKLYARVRFHNTGAMEEFKSSHKTITLELKSKPYDPFIWYELAKVYRGLGFPDLAASTAYKVKELIANGISADTRRALPKKVFSTLVARFKTDSKSTIKDNLKILLNQAMKQELYAMASLQCYKHALREVKESLEFFPDDNEFKAIEKALEELNHISNLDIAETLREQSSVANPIYPVRAMHEISQASGTGVVYKRKYPWMPSDLFKRTSALVEQIDKDLISTNCKLAICPATATADASVDDNDIGCLGIFATQDIKKGDVVMIDLSNLNCSDSRPAQSEVCENCMATLRFVDSSQHVHPTCCGEQITYCSHKCLKVAMSTHHKVLCGMDTNWLVELMGTGHMQNIYWNSFLLLRVLATIIATPQSKDPRNNHPLQHPILARLTASYAETSDPPTNAWNYDMDVIAQHRILRMLGIDFFKDERWSSEVVATIMWRILNNSCTMRGFLTELPGFVNRTKERGDIICLKQHFVFFNHSCEPNVSWLPVDHKGGRIPASYTDHIKKFLKPEQVAGFGDGLNAGGTLMVCFASKDINKGQECSIAYLPVQGKDLAGRSAVLQQWLPGGCRCNKCTAEELEADKASAE